MNKAIFLDRDGIINELVYHGDQESIDSPLTAEQFTLIPGVGQALNIMHEMGYKVVLASNQPGIAKRQLTWEAFEIIRLKMRDELAKENAHIDREYYCFHHPEASLIGFKYNCDCRKPKPGMLFVAARDMNLDLSQSWMLSQNMTDIQAGKAAWCQTILLGTMKCELCRLMNGQEVKPDNVSANLSQALEYICKSHIAVPVKAEI